MKKILIFLLVIALITSISLMGVGCKEEAAEVAEEEEAAEVAEEEEAAEVAEEEEAAEVDPLTVITEEPITIYMTCLAGQTADKWKKWFDMYTAIHPNVTFEKTDFEWSNILELGPSMLASGAEDMDILWWYASADNHQWARDGLLKDLSPLYDIYGYADTLIGSTAANDDPGLGKFFFTDGAVSATVLLYNQTILDEAGVEIPTTLDGLMDIAPAIQATGKDVLTVGATFMYYLTNQLILRTMGPDKYAELIAWPSDPDRTAESAEIFKSQEMIDAFAFFKDWSDAGIIAEGNVGMDYMGRSGNFGSGNSAFYTNGDWEINNIPALIEAAGIEMEWGVTALPPLTEGGYTTYLANPGNGSVVPAYVTDEKLAIIGDFYNYTLTKEWAQETFTTEGIMAVNTGWEEAELTDILTEEYGQFFIDFNTQGASLELLSVLVFEVQDVIAKTTEEVVLGSKSPEEAAEAVYDKLIEVMLP